MNDANDQTILLYTSNYCPHAWAVQRLFQQYELPATIINIDQVPGARQELKTLNGGYASVPTLIFPDGLRMVEPSLSTLKQKLGIVEEGVLDRILGKLL